MEKRWEIKETEDIITQKNLAKELGVKHVIAHLLVLRGVRTFNEAKEFFRPKLSDLHDPFFNEGYE